MTNLDAIRALCTKICSGFYPDKNVLEFTLIDNGIDPIKDYTPKDLQIAKQAISVVMGNAETSHSENGITDSWDREGIKTNIVALCKEHGLDSSEFVKAPTIMDGSNMW